MGPGSLGFKLHPFRSLPGELDSWDKWRRSLQLRDPLRFVFRAGKQRYFSLSTDKNNSPLILKSLAFVSHRPPCTMALCEQESLVQGLPARGPPPWKPQAQWNSPGPPFIVQGRKVRPREGQGLPEADYSPLGEGQSVTQSQPWCLGVQHPSVGHDFLGPGGVTGL